MGDKNRIIFVLVLAVMMIAVINFMPLVPAPICLCEGGNDGLQCTSSATCGGGICTSTISPYPECSPTVLSCGDGICSTTISETCTTCPSDCGTCPLTCDQSCKTVCSQSVGGCSSVSSGIDVQMGDSCQVASDFSFPYGQAGCQGSYCVCALTCEDSNDCPAPSSVCSGTSLVTTSYTCPTNLFRCVPSTTTTSCGTQTCTAAHMVATTCDRTCPSGGSSCVACEPCTTCVSGYANTNGLLSDGCETLIPTDCRIDNSCELDDVCDNDIDCVGDLICPNGVCEEPDCTTTGCTSPQLCNAATGLCYTPTATPRAYWARADTGTEISSSFDYPTQGSTVKLVIENYVGSSVTFTIKEDDSWTDGDDTITSISGTVANGIATATFTFSSGSFTEDTVLGSQDKERKVDGLWREENFEFYFETESLTSGILDVGYSQAALCNSTACAATSAWTGTPTCSDGDVYQNYITNTCVNSVCTGTTALTKKTDCGTLGCTNGVCNTNIPCSTLTPICSSYNSYGETNCNNDENICDFATLPSYCTWTGSACQLTIPVVEYCGDGSCNNGENTTSCLVDCPVNLITCESLANHSCEYGWNCNTADAQYSDTCGAAEVCCTQVISSTQTECAIEGGTCTYESNCATELPGFDCNLANNFCCDVLNSEIEDQTCEDTDTCLIGDVCTLDADCVTDNCVQGICSFDSSTNSYGSCLFADQTSGTDTCEDGYVSYSWIGNWSWKENIYASQGSCGTGCIEKPTNSGIWHVYNDAIAKAYTECTSGSKVLPCPAQVQLPFFNFVNLVIVIVLIGLIYYFFGMKKPVKGKQKITKKKRK